MAGRIIVSWPKTGRGRSWMCCWHAGPAGVARNKGTRIPQSRNPAAHRVVLHPGGQRGRLSVLEHVLCVAALLVVQHERRCVLRQRRQRLLVFSHSTVVQDSDS